MIRYCPKCGHEMIAESIGWKCRVCCGFVDMQGDFHEQKEKPFMPPQTNADRIRAMSDEEFAKAIASKAYTGACNDFDIPYDGKCCHNCEKCDAIIKWLKQPAE